MQCRVIEIIIIAILFGSQKKQKKKKSPPRKRSKTKQSLPPFYLYYFWKLIPSGTYFQNDFFACCHDLQLIYSVCVSLPLFTERMAALIDEPVCSSKGEEWREGSNHDRGERRVIPHPCSESEGNYWSFPPTICKIWLKKILIRFLNYSSFEK